MKTKDQTISDNKTFSNALIEHDLLYMFKREKKLFKNPGLND